MVQIKPDVLRYVVRTLLTSQHAVCTNVTSTYTIKCQPVRSANAADILEAIDEAANTTGIREERKQEQLGD